MLILGYGHFLIDHMLVVLLKIATILICMHGLKLLVNTISLTLSKI